VNHKISAAMIPAVLAAAALPGAALAQDDTWRDLDPQNTLVLEVQKRATTPDELLSGGASQTVVIEMAPELAPGHVNRMKALARQGFYNGRTFHRVIDGFMAQAGGVPGDPTGGESPLPVLQGEFTARIGPDADMTMVQEARRRDPRSGNSPVTEAGFMDGFPVGYQPAAQAMVSADGKRDVWMLHCPGTAAMARTSNPDSANFQFYITRGEPSWLDGQYTAWGRVRAGQDAVDAIKIGEPVAQPDTIGSLRLMADIPEEERPHIQVMRTDSEAFQTLVDEVRAGAEAAGVAVNVCDVEVPTRTAE